MQWWGGVGKPWNIRDRKFKIYDSVRNLKFKPESIESGASVSRIDGGVSFIRLRRHKESAGRVAATSASHGWHGRGAVGSGDGFGGWKYHALHHGTSEVDGYGSGVVGELQAWRFC